MSTVVIVILILAAFGLALLLKKYEHTLLYVIFCAAAFVWFLAMTVMKAKTGPAHIAILLGFVALFALWRTVTLAVRLKRP